MHSIDDFVKNSVSYTEDARELWLDLEERFCVVDRSRIHALKAKLHDCRQTKGMTVTTYFGELKVLWDAIANYEPPFACKCGGCKCNISKTAMARQDSERVHKFHMGLDATLYKTIRSQQLALDPLPSLNRVYHSVLQEERLVSSPTVIEEPTDIMAFAVRSDSSAPVTAGPTPDWRALRDAERQERRKLFCSHCEANGHEAISCFIRTQRFPDWWGDRPKTLADLKAKRAASVRTPARANFLGGSSSIPSSDRLSGMSPTWIIDTRASHHVTGDATWLTEPQPIPPYPVTLPNGQSVSASIAGTYSLGQPLVTGSSGTGPPLDDSGASSGSASADNPDATAPPVEMGRGKRSKIPSTHLSGYVVGTACISSDSDSPPDSPRSSGTPYALANYVSCNNFSSKHRASLAAITTGVEPPTFRAALADPRWCKAMADEIAALENNATWELSTLPPGKKALDCRWVFKIKYNSDGSIERYKARLVILGNHQVEGIDYGETFAPVVKMVTIRAFLAVAAVKKWELHQMDVHNAFLHGDLDEEVYMKLPPGFGNGKEGKVCRLCKSLYGLRQAPRCWFAKLATALRRYGFTQSYSDYSLFSYTQDTAPLHVLVYVDDLVVAGNDSLAISKFKRYLGDCFHMKDLGVLKYFLGIEVARNSEGIFLSQRKYALDIISETGLLGSKPVSTPIEQNHTLGVDTGEFLEDIESYRRLVGHLVYLISCSPGQGILLRSDSELVVTGWCDSDWGSDPSTRRSVSGWLVFLGASLISWKTKKQ
ncbi:uncharacterized protein LOC141613272 [Silene latifolia]|uniref:uncharacterized protein LOC141613272 n=1 Tax=Silene latifolia TaxID=37657 RepID=UPI003D784063